MPINNLNEQPFTTTLYDIKSIAKTNKKPILYTNKDNEYFYLSRPMPYPVPKSTSNTLFDSIAFASSKNNSKDKQVKTFLSACSFDYCIQIELQLLNESNMHNSETYSCIY